MCKHTGDNCARCGKFFMCKIGSYTLCECYEVKLTPNISQWIMEQYEGDCLCADCLIALKKEYTEKFDTVGI